MIKDATGSKIRAVTTVSDRGNGQYLGSKRQGHEWRVGLGDEPITTDRIRRT